METNLRVKDQLRAIERQRLQALLDADLAAVAALHADDFQLVNPLGETLTKADYLEGLASGQIDYRVLEPDSEIAVRLYGDAAAIRYRSQLEIISGGDHVRPCRPLDIPRVLAASVSQRVLFATRPSPRPPNSRGFS